MCSVRFFLFIILKEVTFYLPKLKLEKPLVILSSIKKRSGLYRLHDIAFNKLPCHDQIRRHIGLNTSSLCLDFFLGTAMGCQFLDTQIFDIWLDFQIELYGVVALPVVSQNFGET